MRQPFMAAMAVLFLAVTLAGCIGSPNVEGCLVRPLAPGLGASVDYEVDGRIDVVSASRPAPAQTAAGGESNRGDYVDMVPGDVLTMTVSKAATTATRTLQPTESVNISYSWTAANLPEPLVMMIERLRPDGSLISATPTSIIDAGNGIFVHFARYSNPDRPAGDWASWIWGETIGPGWSNEQVMDGFRYWATEDATEAAFRLQWVSSQHDEQGCLVHLQGTTDRRLDPGREPTTWNLWVRDGASWPERMDFQPTQGIAAHYTLLESRPGTTSWWNPVAATETVAKQQPFVEGVPNGFMDHEAPSTLSQAMQTLRDDGNAGQWLEAHPGARIVRVEHKIGSGDSRLQDKWYIQFVDGPSYNGWHVTYKDPLLIGPDPGTVSVNEDKPDAHPGEPRIERSPGFADMYAAANLVFGQDPERLTCDVVQEYCAFGIYNRSGGSPPDQPRASPMIQTGLYISLGHGQIVFETYQGAPPQPR